MARSAASNSKSTLVDRAACPPRDKMQKKKKVVKNLAEVRVTPFHKLPVNSYTSQDSQTSQHSDSGESDSVTTITYDELESSKKSQSSKKKNSLKSQSSKQTSISESEVARRKSSRVLTRTRISKLWWRHCSPSSSSSSDSEDASTYKDSIVKLTTNIQRSLRSRTLSSAESDAGRRKRRTREDLGSNGETSSRRRGLSGGYLGSEASTSSRIKKRFGEDLVSGTNSSSRKRRYIEELESDESTSSRRRRRSGRMLESDTSTSSRRKGHYGEDLGSDASTYSRRRSRHIKDVGSDANTSSRKRRYIEELGSDASTSSRRKKHSGEDLESDVSTSQKLSTADSLPEDNSLFEFVPDRYSLRRRKTNKSKDTRNSYRLRSHSHVQVPATNSTSASKSTHGDSEVNATSIVKTVRDDEQSKIMSYTIGGQDKNDAVIETTEKTTSQPAVVEISKSQSTPTRSKVTVVEVSEIQTPQSRPSKTRSYTKAGQDKNDGKTENSDSQPAVVEISKIQSTPTRSKLAVVEFNQTQQSRPSKARSCTKARQRKSDTLTKKSENTGCQPTVFEVSKTQSMPTKSKLAIAEVSKIQTPQSRPSKTRSCTKAGHEPDALTENTENTNSQPAVVETSRSQSPQLRPTLRSDMKESTSCFLLVGDLGNTLNTRRDNSQAMATKHAANEVTTHVEISKRQLTPTRSKLTVEEVSKSQSPQARSSKTSSYAKAELDKNESDALTEKTENTNLQPGPAVFEIQSPQSRPSKTRSYTKAGRDKNDALSKKTENTKSHAIVVETSKRRSPQSRPTLRSDMKESTSCFLLGDLGNTLNTIDNSQALATKHAANEVTASNDDVSSKRKSRQKLLDTTKLVKTKASPGTPKSIMKVRQISKASNTTSQSPPLPVRRSKQLVHSIGFTSIGDKQKPKGATKKVGGKVPKGNLKRSSTQVLENAAKKQSTDNIAMSPEAHSDHLSVSLSDSFKKPRKRLKFDATNSNCDSDDDLDFKQAAKRVRFTTKSGTDPYEFSELTSRPQDKRKQDSLKMQKTGNSSNNESSSTDDILPLGREITVCSDTSNSKSTPAPSTISNKNVQKRCVGRPKKQINKEPATPPTQLSHNTDMDVMLPPSLEVIPESPVVSETDESASGCPTVGTASGILTVLSHVSELHPGSKRLQTKGVGVKRKRTGGRQKLFGHRKKTKKKQVATKKGTSTSETEAKHKSCQSKRSYRRKKTATSENTSTIALSTRSRKLADKNNPIEQHSVSLKSPISRDTPVSCESTISCEFPVSRESPASTGLDIHNRSETQQKETVTNDSVPQTTIGSTSSTKNSVENSVKYQPKSTSSLPHNVNVDLSDQPVACYSVSPMMIQSHISPPPTLTRSSYRISPRYWPYYPTGLNVYGASATMSPLTRNPLPQNFMMDAGWMSTAYTGPGGNVRGQWPAPNPIISSVSNVSSNVATVASPEIDVVNDSPEYNDGNTDEEQRNVQQSASDSNSEYSPCISPELGMMNQSTMVAKVHPRDPGSSSLIRQVHSLQPMPVVEAQKQLSQNEKYYLLDDEYEQSQQLSQFHHAPVQRVAREMYRSDNVRRT